jgi:predicted DNA-binding transcriptional regulator AlpA
MSGPASLMMKAQFLRRKAVCSELGVTRHTLAKIIATDKRFPVFFEISPGIAVIERRDLQAWIRIKKTLATESEPQ